MQLERKHKNNTYLKYEKPFQFNKIFNVCKRMIDIFGALIGFGLCIIVGIIFIPFYMFGDNKGCIIFKQQRVGRNGDFFYIYKFRSMVVGAEEKLKADVSLYKRYIDNNYKLDSSEDPRMTKFGAFIRKTSLDELPQFLNVLKGEMSLVGPRPVLEDELKEYGKDMQRFLSVKPGITGYWQVSGRSNVGYPERVGIELYYVEKISLRLDIVIMVKTIKKIMTKQGAY